jgi:uncharacterized protein
MVQEQFMKALAFGSERVVAWADVLDRINVFPVPDGDTGRNLVISLAPLKKRALTVQDMTRALLVSARGSSGNIVARFMTGFLSLEDLADLASSCRKGRDLAYQAVPDPKPGTVLTLFDVLVESLEKNHQDPQGLWLEKVMVDLEGAVKLTASQLAELKSAGVVDAGALGMFVFFDSCLKVLAGHASIPAEIGEKFRSYLTLADSFQAASEGLCVDVVLKVGEGKYAPSAWSSCGESVVTIAEGEYLKVHFHAGETAEMRKRLHDLGEIVAWSEDDLAEQSRRFSRLKLGQAMHVMTDAAGSMTRADAAELNVTLLDSYVTAGDLSLPETYHNPAFILDAMLRGVKVTSSRASIFEQHQHYRKVLSLFPRVLYLCVGSIYTGNYRTVMEWKKANDPEGRLTVIDTGLASGRLGLAARVVAQLALGSDDPEAVLRYARRVLAQCREYIFLEKLQYLAAGGRMSKTGAFFGDLLHVKPIVSPTPHGAVKEGIARNFKEQLAFAFRRLAEGRIDGPEAIIMLEYTDNRQWLIDAVEGPIRERYPETHILLQPLSLSSSVHTGPGTWGMAFLPGGIGKETSSP